MKFAKKIKYSGSTWQWANPIGMGVDFLGQIDNIIFLFFYMGI